MTGAVKEDRQTQAGQHKATHRNTGSKKAQHKDGRDKVERRWAAALARQPSPKRVRPSESGERQISAGSRLLLPAA